MSEGEEKKFVIKHVFTDFTNTGKSEKIERHHNVPWKVRIIKDETSCHIYLRPIFNKIDKEAQWSIDATVEVELLATTGQEVFKLTREFCPDVDILLLKSFAPYEKYVIDGKLTIECHVTINKTEGIRFGKLRDFTDETMKKLSDVALVVEDQKFYVNKMYLAAHSSYFESLLLGNFDESKQSEVELKEIDPWDFQNFFEVIYGEPAIDEDNVGELLKLADMYDAKTAIRQCEEFLIHKSKQDMKVKFEVAAKYKMEKLMVKCISEIKTIGDIEKLMPVESTNFYSKTLSKLLTLSIDLYKKK